jgi:hypothetical protein
MRSAPSLALAAAVLLAAPSALHAQAPAGVQMPDARQMSGVPLPVGDLAPGTVTVRVVRGTMANVIAGQTVDLTGGSSPLSAKTNDAGRAEFTGVTPGTRVKASATVNGERLESQEFTVPSAGGVRVALVATDPATQKPAQEGGQLAQAPAQAGTVVLGERSRFVIEMGDEALNVFSLFDIVNSARVPVQPAQAVVFDLPEAALGAGILDGSTPQAVVAGKQVSLSDLTPQVKEALARGQLPAIYVSTGPAELIQTAGPAEFQPIAATQILDVTNTSSSLFFYPPTQHYHLLIAGRWFRARALGGPWAFVEARALPREFAQIPLNHPKGGGARLRAQHPGVPAGDHRQRHTPDRDHRSHGPADGDL